MVVMVREIKLDGTIKELIRYSPKFEKNRNFFFFKLFGKL